MAKEVPEHVLLLMAEKFRMLSDPTRLQILRTLMLDGELNVTQIAERTHSTQTSISKQLKQLADAHLVCRRKEGVMVIYRLSDPIVEQICKLVCDSILSDLESEVTRNREVLRSQKGGRSQK